jgi:hypothetical protein
MKLLGNSPEAHARGKKNLVFLLTEFADSDKRQTVVGKDRIV